MSVSGHTLPPRERLALTAEGLRIELAGGWRMAADPRSGVRFGLDALGYRARRIVQTAEGGRRHRIRLRGGAELTYRTNRGDIRAIAEVWLSEGYRLPHQIRARNIVDLGANIGAAAVWLHRRYGGVRVVAVEPVPDSASLAELNLARNGIDGNVVRAAVGAHEGTARFETSSISTLGRIGPGELGVAVVTPAQILERFPPSERIDLVKIDVEGAEQQLFDGDLAWLDRVDSVAMELHTDRVDWRAIIATLSRLGFDYYELGTANPYRGPSDLTAAFFR